MEDAAFGELIGLCCHAVLHKPVSVEVDPAAGVFRQRWLQRQNAAQPVCAFLKVGVTKHQIVLNESAESLLTQQWVRDKRAGQDVALHGNR
ncbi:hypothetical protein D3C73_1180120 [compost metagenome]